MKVELREWKRRDAAVMAEQFNNEKIARFLRDGFRLPYTVEDAREYIDVALKASPVNEWSRAIWADGEWAGSIVIARGQDVYRRSAELGYTLAEPFWGRGIATRPVTLLCGEVFRCSDIVRIKAEVFAPNAASCRVLEKCGFALEGTLRKSVYKRGQLLDAKLYALVRD